LLFCNPIIELANRFEAVCCDAKATIIPIIPVAATNESIFWLNTKTILTYKKTAKKAIELQKTTV